MQNQQTEKIRNIIIRALKGDKEITAVYLFGSYGKGKFGPMSDIDVGILLDKKFPKEHYTEKRLKLLSKIVSGVKSDKIDLVIMNEAPVTLTYQIIKAAFLLLEREHLKRVEFETKIMDKYLDTIFIRKLYMDKMMYRIKKGGFGDYRSRTYQNSLAKVRRMYQKA